MKIFKTDFFFENPFFKVLDSRSIRNTMHKKDLKFALVVELAAKIYLYHNTKIAKASPHRVECPTNSSVQKQRFMD